jgi:hypothetical protein
VIKSTLLFFAFVISILVSEFILVVSAFAQSGAPTGTFVNPSVPNGVESNPQTFENVQPVVGQTPPPTQKVKRLKPAKGGNVQSKPSSFVSSPETMVQEQSTPAPKVNN